MERQLGSYSCVDILAFLGTNLSSFEQKRYLCHTIVDTKLTEVEVIDLEPQAAKQEVERQLAAARSELQGKHDAVADASNTIQLQVMFVFRETSSDLDGPFLLDMDVVFLSWTCRAAGQARCRCRRLQHHSAPGPVHGVVFFRVS